VSAQGKTDTRDEECGASHYRLPSTGDFPVYGNSKAENGTARSTETKEFRCRDGFRGDDTVATTRRKILVLGVLVVLALVPALYLAICAEEPRDSDPFALLSSSQDGGSGPVPAVFSGNLKGRPLTESMRATTNSNGFDAQAKNRDHGGGGDDEGTTTPKNEQQLRFLIDLLSPVVSEISEREGYYHNDYVASRRNDESIVVKGSPQHNALAWLSHAVVCLRRSDTGTDGGSSLKAAATDEEGHRRYDCESMLSRSQLINRYALATVYFAWDGKSWEDAEGWLSYDPSREDYLMPSPESEDSVLVAGTEFDPASRYPSDVCLWKGVTCRQETMNDDATVNESNHTSGNAYDSEDGGEQIVGLNLSGNNLVGSVAAAKEIGLLSSLGVLDVSRNHLGGRVPTDLGRLAELRSLSLSSNLLTGVLPPWIASSSLPRLEAVHLEDNFLVGGLDDFRLASPCGDEAPRILSADCSGSKPLVECPCCTRCCGKVFAGSAVRGSVAAKTTKQNVCTPQTPERSTAATSSGAFLASGTAGTDDDS